MRSRRLLLLGAVLVAGCGGGASSPPPLPEAPARLYEYDAQAPFGERDRLVPNEKIPVKVHDISFGDARGGVVVAYLCLPPGKGPFPGVVLIPGSGGGRTDLLVQGIQLAARGAVAMAILTPFIHGTGEDLSPLEEARSYRRNFVDNVVAVRRSFDLLQRRRGVDADRLGLAGYSLGASLAAVVSGVDPRPRAVVLVAPPSHPHFYPPLRGRTAVKAREILRPVDPKRYLRRARARLFLELARHDQIQARPEQRAVIRAAGPGATVKWYPTGHDMNRQAWRDLVRRLGDELGLGPLPAYARVP